MLRAVLFDLDGTLVDSEPLAIEALLAAAHRHDHGLTADVVMKHPGAHFAAMLMAELRVTEEEAEAVCATYDEIFLEEAVPRIAALPGANELVAQLARAGTSLGIVTNKPLPLVEAVLATLGWDVHFQVTVAHGMAAENKPSPAPAFLALERLGRGATETVFIGDTAGDMACGRTAGLRAVIGVGGTSTAEVLFAAGATHFCRSLREAGELIAPWVRSSPS